MSSEESREDPGDHTEDNIFQSQWHSVKVRGSLKRQIIFASGRSQLLGMSTGIQVG